MRRATVSPVIFPHPPFCLYLTGNLSVCSSRNGYRTLLNGFHASDLRRKKDKRRSQLRPRRSRSACRRFCARFARDCSGEKREKTSYGDLCQCCGASTDMRLVSGVRRRLEKGEDKLVPFSLVRRVACCWWHEAAVAVMLTFVYSDAKLNWTSKLQDYSRSLLHHP